MSSTLRQRGASPSQGQVEKARILKETEEKELSEGQKFIVPNFTVKQLLDAIPAHCFKRSAIRSSLYIVQDAIAIAALVYGAYHIDSFLGRFNLSNVAFHAARAALYIAYTVVTGFFGTGIWVIAHECGHQGFSSSRNINFVVGWVLHSALLVPFHSWRISHARHHAATGHMTRDEVFVPKTRKQLGLPELAEEGEVRGLSVSESRQAEFREALDDSPLVLIIKMILRQTLGWPLYLFMNATGQEHYPAGTNHFTPSSIIFKPSQYSQVLMSDLGCILMLGALGYWAFQRSVLEVVAIYGIPYLWVNNWLVAITFLQHTDAQLPHYSPEKWTFARGALATIDRNFFGFVGPYILHGIAETHVCHHICSKIPHYNAWEATQALKEFLGVHYYKSEENFLVSFWKSSRDCQFVEDEGDVLFFKNASGVAARVAVEEENQFSDSGVDMGETR
ncbi:putative delta-12 fatty acid desaturase [Kockovaella imperatae]|uniref:Putative delta-12 fatty acid desaturase n=1 Tax=Kockovaella imperatae TaxID=4999 RepID=A0A1Y1UQ63_9TREE|nr:putative delta-12 fatty acid desaturase [Kockovaella imperatae]ORX40112.1 putative delta-12 fatty acid desaturase [Kockovaella imperatae]